MEDVETLKAQIKKLNAQATNLKMNLHDLAEDLPTGWEKIPEVATQAYEAYKNLTEARSRLAAAAGPSGSSASESGRAEVSQAASYAGAAAVSESAPPRDPTAAADL